MSERSRRGWLCLPPIVFCLVDHVLAMRGQSAGYWSGNLNESREANPVVDAVFRQGHVFAQLLPVVWCILFSSVILWVSRRPALYISLGITIAHALCACSWLYGNDQDGYGYYQSLVLCVFCAAVVAFCLERWHPWPAEAPPAPVAVAGHEKSWNELSPESTSEEAPLSRTES